MPSHTYCAGTIPFGNGAKLVWSDIDFRTRVVDLNDIKKKVIKKLKQ